MPALFSRLSGWLLTAPAPALGKEPPHRSALNICGPSRLGVPEIIHISWGCLEARQIINHRVAFSLRKHKVLLSVQLPGTVCCCSSPKSGSSSTDNRQNFLQVGFEMSPSGCPRSQGLGSFLGAALLEGLSKCCSVQCNLQAALKCPPPPPLPIFCP